MSITDRYRGLFLGSIGVLAETSDIQRQAFNLAFRQSGLDWDWDRETYRSLIQTPGGARRIAAEAERLGVAVDADKVHARKVANFRAAVLREGLTPRPGVIETIEAMRNAGLAVAWVTATGRPTVELVLEGFGGAIREDMFDFVCDSRNAVRGKPSPEIYVHALERAGLGAGAVLAVEDTPESAEAAVAAGIDTIGFPGWAAQGRSFPPGVQIVDRLGADMDVLKQSA